MGNCHNDVFLTRGIGLTTTGQTKVSRCGKTGGGLPVAGFARRSREILNPHGCASSPWRTLLPCRKDLVKKVKKQMALVFGESLGKPLLEQVVACGESHKTPIRQLAPSSNDDMDVLVALAECHPSFDL